ncbi:hypothetical protein ACHCAL_21145 [Providencia huaxiensis]|uniref:hypothetical protein n=2 Tax=Providencia huaxiensis TaxID=2027290 RepID=UPI003758076D
MNKIEAFIYSLVKKNAPLKNFFVLCYQSIFLLKSIFSKKIDCNLDYQEVDGFFGFHDRPSMNSNGLLLVHRQLSEFKDSMGLAQLGLVDSRSNINIFKPIVTTSACNYQQGSLATWLTDDYIILNNNINDNEKCQIYDSNGKLIKTFPFHFFSASKCGRYITSLSFARFGKGLNGYGYDIHYNNIEYTDSKEKTPRTSFGDIFVYDLENEKEIYRFSIQSFIDKSMGLLEDGYMYFSHSNFSPNSEFLYFLLRSSNNKINTSQLITVNLVNGNILFAPTNGMVSHLDWLSNTEIIAYCNCLGSYGDGYYIFTITEHSVTSQKINIKRLSSDGHPSALSEKLFITDTYPSRDRKQFLIAVDLIENKTEDIANFYSPLKFRGIHRTDLHPRLSKCKKYITIDTSYKNKRSQLIINIESLSKKNLLH